VTRRIWVVPAVAAFVAGCALNQTSTGGGADASPITEAAVRGHMAFLASDALNGRASGSRDEWIAASYLGAQMQEWGLEPLGDAGGFVQEVSIERPETSAPPALSAGSTVFTHGNEMRVQTLGAAKASGPLQRFAEGTPVKPGTVVLMPPSFAPPAGRGGGSAATMAQIAPAAIVLMMDNPDLPRPAAGARLPSPPPQLVGVTAAPRARFASVLLGKEAYTAIAALAEGTPVSLTAEVKTGTPSKTWNAVGRLTGSDPASAKDVILLSAHLDHVGAKPGSSGDSIFNGADDDASGTIAVLELARALALGPRPKRTIVFAFFGSEEAGGYGSRFFADKPVVALADIVANLQFEMIGRPDNKVPAHTLWLTGYERSTLGPALAKQGAKLVQDPHPEQSFFTRSDNIQFARRGVIAHTVSSFGLHKDYHQPSDEMKTIDFAHMTDAIRSMLDPVRWLANSGFKPDWLPGMKP
jgi:peptidase M28-like protein